MLNKLKKLVYMGLILLSTTIVLADLYIRVLAGEKLSLIEGAKFIPQDALMAVYVATDSRLWEQLQELGTPKSRTLINQKLTNWDEIAALTGIDYQQDIQPWIGNAVMALMPSDRSELAHPNDLLLVVGIKNKFKALNFARKLENQRAKQIQINSYRDIPIVTIAEGDNPPLILAVLNRQVLVSFNQKTVEQAVDTFKGNSSLASQAKILAQMERQNSIVQAYIPNYNPAFKEALRLPDRVAQVTLEQLEPIQSVVLEVGINQPGLRLWAIAELDPAQQKSLSTAETEALPLSPTPKPGMAQLGLGETIADESDRLEIQVRQAITHFLQTHAEVRLAIEPLLDSLEKIDVTVTNSSQDSSSSSSERDYPTSRLELLLFLKP